MTVDARLVAAWLAARSIARQLPALVADHGGLRVDTGAADERRRYLFVDPCEGLRRLGATIDAPFVALKLCRPGNELLALLPARWQIGSDNWMMVWDHPRGDPEALPRGYALTLEAAGPLIRATIADQAGAACASGFAVAHDGIFLSDRIRVEEGHRRRGVGTALIRALASRADPTARHVLTATPEGRALYHAIGWRDYCPYATALIPPR